MPKKDSKPEWELEYEVGPATLHTWKCMHPKQCAVGGLYHTVIECDMPFGTMVVKMGSDMTQGGACTRFNRLSKLMDESKSMLGLGNNHVH